MSAWAERAAGIVVAVALTFATMATCVAAGKHYGLGQPATPGQVAGWDIDIRPDGQGLPPGKGTAEAGEALYMKQCASCHGEFGEARGRYPVLMGGSGTLDSEDPVKTIGSYWPYASTVFDYVRRAMPFGHAQSLSADETYAITAFLLNLNDLIEYEQELNAENLARIEMPNRHGFVQDTRPDVPTGEPCMTVCGGELKLLGKARVIDVTPEETAPSNDTSAPASGSGSTPGAAAEPGGDATRGEQVFQVCGACHSLRAGEHRVGPSLSGIVGRKAATVEGFDRYSEALRASNVVWSEANLARYIHSPQGFVAGTNMPFPGIPAEDQVRDLLAYLRSAAKVSVPK